VDELAPDGMGHTAVGILSSLADANFCNNGGFGGSAASVYLTKVSNSQIGDAKSVSPNESTLFGPGSNWSGGSEESIGWAVDSKRLVVDE
jgi:hypothetical protein